MLFFENGTVIKFLLFVVHVFVEKITFCIKHEMLQGYTNISLKMAIKIYKHRDTESETCLLLMNRIIEVKICIPTRHVKGHQIT